MQTPTEGPGASAKHYAFLLVCWGTETWMATVFEGESRILIIENGDVITTTASGLTVDRAIELAKERRDAVIALRRRTKGRPDVVHTVIEPSGDPALMDERMRRTPPTVQTAIPRWLVVLSGLEVAVATAFAFSVRPFGARHVVVGTLIFCTLTAFLMLELRAARRAVSVTGGETSPPAERMAPPDEGGRRG
jgi:hypothetical protein